MWLANLSVNVYLKNVKANKIFRKNFVATLENLNFIKYLNMYLKNMSQLDYKILYNFAYIASLRWESVFYYISNMKVELI